jgi:hypothetical protein
MSIDPQFAIKKDIRNNPVIRNTDDRQKREYLRTALLTLLGVSTLVLLMLPHTDNRLKGYRMEDLREQLALEQSVNRKLRLNLEARLAPAEVEKRARALGLRPPRLEEVAVIEIVPESGMPDAVVARATTR